MSRTDITSKRNRVVRTDMNIYEKVNSTMWESGPFIMFMLAGMVLFVTQFFELFILAWWIVYKLHGRAPYPELPTNSETDKQSAKLPLFSFGMEINLKKPVWFSDTQMRQHILVMGTTGAGKAQPLDAMVHTPEGWQRMGDLAVGMSVSTPDGKNARILGIFPQGKVPIYRVEFEDGRVTEACGNHLWDIHHKRRGGGKRIALGNLNTLEIQKLLEIKSGEYAVRLADPVRKSSGKVPVDAYLLGTLLGAGSLDHDLEEDAGGLLRHELEILGLWGLGAEAHFIPESYLEADVGERWALLQGLMDVRGYCQATQGASKPSLSFSSDGRLLAANVQRLVRSLGGIASLIERDNRFSVNIRMKDPSLVFGRGSRMAGEMLAKEDDLALAISSITYVGEKEAQCIYIEHEDHLYITDDYIVTHNTELLLYLSTQAMAMGSGVIFVDGKGDVKTWFRLFAIARRLGLEENLRVLNFGTNIEAGEYKYHLSNTINIFTIGDAGQIKEMMSALMAEAGGDNAMWKGRAESMMGSELLALVDLRDLGEIQLSASVIAEYMVLDKLAGFETNPNISQLARDEVKRYLDSLPGFRAGQQGKAEADKQHGFLTMQFTEILGLLNNTYTHIMAFPLGEINMLDVIINRRSLYVMLPSMEKSGNSVKNLGKIIVQQIRAALSKTLGAGIRGTKSEKLDARPTTSTTPMLCILDEYGSYAVEGFGEVAAQARSIGFSTCFAVQDWASLEKADSRGMEALRIWANTNIKVFMKVEDSKSTMPLVLERVKRGFVLQSSGKEYNRDSTFGGERGQATSGYHEVDRLDPQELFTLKDGAFFVIYEDRFHRVQSPWLSNSAGAWKDQDWVAPARLVPVSGPSVSEIEKMIDTKKKMGEMNSRLDDPTIFEEMDIPDHVRSIEECFQAIRGDVTPFASDDYQRRGLIYVRNFLRSLLQMSANQARKDFGSTDTKPPPAATTSGAGESGVSRVQKTNPSSVPWNSVAPNIPEMAPDDVVDEDHFTETVDDEPIDTSDDPDIDEHPEDLNNQMPRPITREDYVPATREIISATDSETGKFVVDRLVKALMKTRNPDDEDDD